MRHLSKFLPLKCSLIQKVHLRSLFAFLGWHVEGVYVCVFVCVHLCVHVLPQKRSFFFSQVEGCTEFVTVKTLVFVILSLLLFLLWGKCWFLSQLLHLEDNHTYFSRLIWEWKYMSYELNCVPYRRSKLQPQELQNMLEVETGTFKRSSS